MTQDEAIRDSRRQMNPRSEAASERAGLPYRAAKTIFLLAHGAILPLSIHYLLGQLPETFWRYLFIAGIYTIIPFWLILFIALPIIHFPLRRNAALVVTGGMILEFAVFAAVGGDLLFSVYALFFTSFLGIIFVLHAFIAREMTAAAIPEEEKEWWRFALLAGLVLANGLFVFALAIPFVQDLSRIPGLAGRLAALAVLLVNAVSMGRAVSRNIGPNAARNAGSEEAKERDQEAERWMPATAGVLILSLTGAIFAAMAGGKGSF